MIVYLFAIGKGIASKFFVGKIILYLAEISPFAFLVHNVVFRYLSIIYYKLPVVGGQRFASKYGSWINLTLGLFVTIIISELYMRITKRSSKYH